MKNIKALLTLEVNLIKPYWKWLLMFFGISLLVGIFMGGGFAFMLNVAIFAATILAFPFENVEKGNMETLYAVLPTNRKSMIFARYLFAVIFLAITIVLGIGIGLLIDFIMLQIPLSYEYIDYVRVYSGFRVMNAPSYVQMLFTMLAVAFSMYMVTFSIQTPFFYKFGYKKGRIFMWIPLIIILAASVLPAIISLAGGPNFNIFNAMIETATARIITSSIAVGVGLLFPIGSFFLSRKMYLRKDI